MKRVFADSSYFVALMSAQDAWHEAASRWDRQSDRPLLLTEFVLLEVANTFSAVRRRQAFKSLLATIEADQGVVVLPASTELLHAGLKLYLDRSDKEWSLTDCISFVVMQKHGIYEALTADHHFQQAGFTPLLRNA